MFHIFVQTNNKMKFIETKREELRRERIALNEQEWEELVELLKGIGEKLRNDSWGTKEGCSYLWFTGEHWLGYDQYLPTITVAELKAKYFEPETREPKPGDWGYFWDDKHPSAALFGQLAKRQGLYYPCVNGSFFKNFSHTIPPHIQELMKTPQYEVIHSFGESDGEIVVEKEIGNGYYAGTRGGVNVVLKRITP